MFESILGETGGTIAQFILALLVVLLLIVLIAWLVRRFGGKRFGAGNNHEAELEVVTSLAIDPKRKLVLVRHGKLEHLLLIGGGSDEVVERSIVGGVPIAARLMANKTPEKPKEDNILQRSSGQGVRSDRFASALARKQTETAEKP
ncbi:MAG: flagellar biosynthetic protein FliO, partial [Devosiaceae bacterium]